MERNTILAVILSTLVFIGFFIMQGVFFPQTKPVEQTQPPFMATPSVTEGEQGAQQTSQTPQTPQTATPQQSSPATPSASPSAADDVQSQTLFSEGPQETEYITIDTNLVTVVLTNAGGSMVSWKLKDHIDSYDNVNMILGGNEEARAFSIAFGGLDAQPVSSLFYVNRVSEYTVEFYRDFLMPSSASMPGSDGRFRLIKRYDFKPNDYMFELTVTLDGGFSTTGFNFFGSAYTLSFGPQIGPKFDSLDGRYEYRQYATFVNGKLKTAKVNDVIETRPAWAAISGKYFTFIAIPYLAQYSVSFSERAEPGLLSASRFNIIRPAVSAPRVSDTYRFYLGPKTQEVLAVYNTGKNEFGIKEMNLIDVTTSSFAILSPLEKLLKWLLLLFHGIVHNYGVAIILTTMLVKILFFPLTKKGSEATFRMQALAPKIKEIQEKYKNNPQKLRVEMGNFYSKEGYNPISGCLPMLLQIPIFIAMYNLFNNHFDLRGAEFIPGWIPDLSVPEAILYFPGNFRLPFLGNALRALPFIYVGSQLLYGKVTQMPGQQSNAQMKMMLYVMPIIFFFVLYNMPSGLLVYWIFANILTLVQQLIINKYVLAKRVAQAEQQPVIAPGKKKNK